MMDAICWVIVISLSLTTDILIQKLRISLSALLLPTLVKLPIWSRLCKLKAYPH